MSVATKTICVLKLTCEQEERKHRDLIREALRQLNAALEARRGTGRNGQCRQLILGPEVVDALVRSKPKTQAELDATHIPNFSKNKRRQYGQQILSTMTQVCGALR